MDIYQYWIDYQVAFIVALGVISIIMLFVLLLAHFFMVNSLAQLNKKYNTYFPAWLMWAYAFIPGLFYPTFSLLPLVIFMMPFIGTRDKEED